MSERGSAAEWYVSVNGAQHGPMSEAELKGLVQQRHISPDDHVWCPNFTEWKRAGDVFPQGTRTPPPPPPSAPRSPAPAAKAATPAAHAPVGRASGGIGGMAVASFIFYGLLFLVMAFFTFLIVLLGSYLHWFFFIFLVAMFFAFRIVFREFIIAIRQNVFTVDEHSFRQNGVVVDFDRRTVKVNGREFTPDQVKDTAMTWTFNSASIDISVDDVGKPVERVRFVTFKAKEFAEDFLERLNRALAHIQ